MPKDQEAIERLTDQWEMVMQWGAMLALCPIEEWLNDLNHTHTIAPILDPTAYREYIYSGKGEIISSVLEGALVFKKAIIKAQQDVLSNPRLARELKVK